MLAGSQRFNRKPQRLLVVPFNHSDPLFGFLPESRTLLLLCQGDAVLSDFLAERCFF